MRLVRPTKIYWNFITNGHKELRRKPIESWEEIKVKLKEIYFPDFYMNCLVDKLHNPHKSRHIVSSNDASESKIFEEVNVLFEITCVENTLIIFCPYKKIVNVIKNISIDSCLSPSSLDEGHVSLKDTTDTSDVVDALMESSAPITNEINIHDDNHYSEETKVESILVIHSVSSSSESLEFLVMLHKVNYEVSSFSECLDFSP